MKIKVTKADIKNGKRKSASSCPIALAVKRATKQKLVVVDEEYIGFGKSSRSYTEYKIPDKASVFIATFDDGDKVKPFSFALEKIVGRP